MPFCRRFSRHWGRLGWGLLCLFLVFSLSPVGETGHGVVVRFAAGWSGNYFDATYGPCGWNNFAPGCPKCNQATTDVQYSPIAFTEKDHTTTPMASGLCFSRAFPYIEVPGTKGRMDLVKPASTVIIDLNGGGVLRAKCIDNAPMFVKVWKCASEDTSSESSDATHQVVEDGLYELVRIQIYNGPNHALMYIVDNFFEPGSFYETEYHFFKAQQKGVTVHNEPYYTSRCHSSILQKEAPDFILSFFATPSSRQTEANSSVTIQVLGDVASIGPSIKNSSGYYDSVNVEQPLLPLLATTTVRSGIEYYYYKGSLCEPPCWTPVPRVVVQTILKYPPSIIQLLSATTPQQWNGGGSLTRPTLEGTEIYRGVLYQMITEYDLLVESEAAHGAEEVEPVELDIRIWVLLILDLLLFAVVLLMLFSRFELMDVFPPRLGGLNSMVQWDTRSYALAAELKAHEAEVRELEKIAEKKARPSSRSASAAPPITLSGPVVAGGTPDHLAVSMPSSHYLVGSQDGGVDDVEVFPQHQAHVQPREDDRTGVGLVTFQNTDTYSLSGDARRKGGESNNNNSHANANNMSGFQEGDPTKEFQGLMSGVDRSRCL